jgi:hypothetical protein
MKKHIQKKSEVKSYEKNTQTENIMKMVDEVIGREKLDQPDPFRTTRIMTTLINDVHPIDINYWNKAFRIGIATIGLAASVAIGISLGGIYNRTNDYNQYIVMVHDAQIENLDFLIEE